MAKQQEAPVPVRMIRLPEVMALTGLSHVSIWRLERAGEFPKRRRIGGRMIAWRSDELDEWRESREIVSP